MMISRTIGYQAKNAKHSTAPIRNPCADPFRCTRHGSSRFSRTVKAKPQARAGSPAGLSPAGVNGALTPAGWGECAIHPKEAAGSAVVGEDLVDLAGGA